MKIYSISSAYYNNQMNFCGIKNIPTQKQCNELRVFSHHIYEYEKGLRDLILTTEKQTNQSIIEERLNKKNISYLIQKVSENKINVFFGDKDAIKVIRSFNKPKLNEYTPEQDFILGALLGYNKILECRRFLKLIKFKK